VVVDDGGAAALQRFDRAEHRRPTDHLEVERGVESPPHLFEDLEERGGLLRRRRHAARQRRVEVMVPTDEA
jgi:hypothetical protein